MATKKVHDATQARILRGAYRLAGLGISSFTANADLAVSVPWNGRARTVYSEVKTTGKAIRRPALKPEQIAFRRDARNLARRHPDDVGYAEFVYRKRRYVGRRSKKRGRRRGSPEVFVYATRRWVRDLLLRAWAEGEKE